MTIGEELGGKGGVRPPAASPVGQAAAKDALPSKG